MRIEPTSRPLARLSSDRRLRAHTRKSTVAADTGDAANRKSSRTGDSPGAATGERGLVVLQGPDQDASQRLSLRRWRSHVPFIAQYIGQETSLETPARYVRRHSETARKAYEKQAAFTPHSRTVARV